MILLLRVLFLLVLASMLWVTTWASLRCPLFDVPRDVFMHPWFIATMFDAYWGFTTFLVWVCYKQTSWLARFAWFVAIMLLGNIAMASYCLAEFFRVQTDGSPADVLTIRRAGVGLLGPLLALAGLGVVTFAVLV
ncbi:MAG: DUF1475 family protein [Opitutaceae bacterium]